jgi:hypothetical protein
VTRAFVGSVPLDGSATPCFALVGSHHRRPFGCCGGHQRQQPGNARWPTPPGDP